MLDQKDLQNLQNMMERVFDTRIGQTEEKMERMINTKNAQSENLVLQELERTRNILEERIDMIQKNMEELNQYYKITKLENENTSLVLKMIDGLTKRVEELEKRTA